MKNLLTNKKGSVSIELAAVLGLLAVIFTFIADLGVLASNQFKTDRLLASMISIAKQQKLLFSTKNDFNERILQPEDEIAKQLNELANSLFNKEFKDAAKYGLNVQFFKYKNEIDKALESDNSYSFGEIECEIDTKDAQDLAFLRNNDLWSDQIAITLCGEYEPIFANTFSAKSYSKTLIAYVR